MRVREGLQQKNKKASRFTLACIIGGRKEALAIPPGVEIKIETAMGADFPSDGPTKHLPKQIILLEVCLCLCCLWVSRTFSS